MGPVIDSIRASDALKLRFIHTGQHYDKALSESFLRTLGLPTPDEHLGVGSGSHGEQTARALEAIDRDIVRTDPAAVLAQGDTNAVLSASLATSKRDAVFGHVEAGIRSYDRSMPEEVNRVVADHLAELRFAPTEVAAGNLADEGIRSGVTVTGNTVVDACLAYRDVAEEESTVLERFGVTPDEYVAATIHRPRNTDDRKRLRRILRSLDDHSAPVLLPAHPRTRQAIDQMAFDPPGSLCLVDPLGYLDFLRLIDNARLIVTDSGGVQEEASILETPCLTVRPNTERPETIGAGVNELVEPSDLSDRLRAVYEQEYESMTGASRLFGDGRAGKRIVRAIGEIVAGDVSVTVERGLAQSSQRTPSP